MEFIKFLLFFTEVFFVIYLMCYALILASSTIIGALSTYEKIKKNKLKNILEVDEDIKVSIIVPAYNEEVTIIDTIESLIHLEYNSYEIIVVNDGSKDNTLNKVIKECQLNLVEKYVINKLNTKEIKAIYEGVYKGVLVTLVDKENGGKADALNAGIDVANSPWFISIDADSVLQSDSLKKVVVPILEDDTVIASGGAIMVGNGVTLKNGKVIKYDLPKNLFAAMQTIEYNRTFLASRIMFDKVNANLIISGAFGLFRKDIVIAAGGYEPSTRGEDMELVVKLHSFCRLNKRKYKIRYVQDAICWTQVPERFKDLATQRKRWHIGLYECMKKYKNSFLNSEQGLFGKLSYFYFLLYEFLSPYIEAFGILATIALFLFNVINVDFMIIFYLFYALMGVMISAATYASTVYINELDFSIGKFLKVILLCILEVCFLRFALSCVRFISLIGYKKNKYYWGKIKRIEMSKV